MKITKEALKKLIKEEMNKELAGDFLENDVVDYLIKIGAIKGPNDEAGYDSDMDRVYRDAATFLEKFAIPYLRRMADNIERA